MGHTPLPTPWDAYADRVAHAAALNPDDVGECRYCGRAFIYGERADCVSCGGLTPLVNPRRKQRPTYDWPQNVSMSASTRVFAGSAMGFGWP